MAIEKMETMAFHVICWIKAKKICKLNCTSYGKQYLLIRS